jgi:hypothetical protein
MLFLAARYQPADSLSQVLALADRHLSGAVPVRPSDGSIV